MMSRTPDEKAKNQTIPGRGGDKWVVSSVWIDVLWLLDVHYYGEVEVASWLNSAG